MAEMESTTHSVGRRSRSSRSATSTSVEAATSSPAGTSPRRRARWATCATDSSAAISSTGVASAANSRRDMRASVDLPTPGSPKSSVVEPAIEAAAHDAVEFADPVECSSSCRGDVAQRSGGHRRRNMGPGSGSFFVERVPLATTRTATTPTRGRRTAFSTDVHGMRLHSMRLRVGCDLRLVGEVSKSTDGADPRRPRRSSTVRRDLRRCRRRSSDRRGTP